MSFLNTFKGKILFEQYLKRFEGGSLKVYRSEIKMFFDYKNVNLSDINKRLLHSYSEAIAKDHSQSTLKRKISILNSFFKYLDKKLLRFSNPIGNLKEFKAHKGINSEDIQNYLKDFISRQNTVNTKRSYENLIKLFFTYINKDLMDIYKSDILTYRDHLRENGNKDATIWNKFIALNRFFKYVEKENRKFLNPIVFNELSLIFPKRDRGYYSVLSAKEAERFLKQPDKRTDIGKRDYAIILLMLVYGLRINEVAKLNHSHLESERIKGQQKVWIRDRKGKFQNRPETAIILNKRALKAFDAWIDVVKKEGIKITGELPIFLPFTYDRIEGSLVIKRTRIYKNLSVKALEDRVTKYIKKSKIQKDGKTLSAHALRHTAFTMLAQAGRPIQDIQKLAGHRDINTTMIYVHAVQSYDDHPGMYSPLNK